MFSITLKRSVATLGVVAGLLAAAGPASAQALPGVVGLSEQGWGTTHLYMKAPTNAGTQVGSEGVKAPTKAGPQPEANGYTHMEEVSFTYIRGDAQDTQTSRTSSVENCTRMANADYCAVSKEPASKYVPVPAGCAGLDHWINQGVPERLSSTNEPPSAVGTGDRGVGVVDDATGLEGAHVLPPFGDRAPACTSTGPRVDAATRGVLPAAGVALSR
jgi:hypothetical protein